MRQTFPVRLIAAAVLSGGAAGAQSVYQDDIRPVLEKQCQVCHNSTAKQGGLDLTTSEKMLRGGDRGPAVVPGEPGESLLMAYIAHKRQPGMPMGGKPLAPEVIAKFGEWIKAGAPFGDKTAVKLRSAHWSFQRVERPAVPAVKHADWRANPVDAFLAAEHEKRGLNPRPQADRHTLLRRVYLDLIGMPPSPAQVAAFVNDRSPNAYERVVDALLASQHYGERWGRHWMDIWRYSDWYGSGENEVRNSHRHIWRWRDWIVDSLNEDKSYGRMIEEMLAGDEIAPADPKVLAATGFLARNWYRFNRNVWMVDTIESTTAAFLGVTLKCARCHDHKYDPFPQQDYYRFRAFFEPHDIRIDRVAGQPDRRKAGLARAYDSEAKDAGPDNEGGINMLPPVFGKTYVFVRGDENSPDKEQEMQPATPGVLGGPDVKIAAVEQPLEAFYPDVRPFVAGDLIEAARAEVKAAEGRLERLRAEFEEARREAGKPAPATPAGTPIDFAKEVKPLLDRRCANCHEGRNAKAGLSVASEQSIRAGGRSGPAALAGKSGESLLIQFVRGQKQPRMPLNGPALGETEIKLLAGWIDRLPRKKPEEILKESPALISAAGKDIAAAKAELIALEARVKAEHAKHARVPDPDLDKLVAGAKVKEREANVLRTDEQVFRAQAKMTEALALPAGDEEERKVRDRSVAAAKRNLEAALAALNKPVDAYSPLGPSYPKLSTGRRLALAKWITSRDNPLAARVAVNHIWLRHFGKPLVASVIDFGKNGKTPTHPALLDWLAADFMENGWSMKRLHRMLVMSRAYRMDSGAAAGADDSNLAADRDNLYLWRMNTRRMEAEAIRDSVLQVSGALDETMGGPELHEEKEQDTPRRSLYFHITPDAQLLFLKVFDGADPTACFVRPESIVPQQALALANSKLSFASARMLAEKLGGLTPPAADFVRSAFLHALARPVTETELQKSIAYLDRHAALLGKDEAAEATAGPPQLRARQSLVHALFNRDEFVTIR